MKTHKNYKIIAIGLLLVVSTMGFWWYVNKYVYRSKAEQPKVNITFSEKTGEVAVNQEKAIDVTIQPADTANKISGIDLDFKAEGVLTIASVRNIVNAADGTSTLINNLRDESSGTRRTIVMNNDTPTANIPAAYRVRVVVKATQAGQGKLKVKKGSGEYQMVGPVTGYFYDLGTVDEGAFTFSGNVNGTPTPTPTLPAGSGNATLNFKVKFQGITSKPENIPNLRVRIFIPSLLVDPFFVDFVANNDGTWSGSKNLTVIPGSYGIAIKGPKHLQKKICTNKPTESETGKYICPAGLLSSDRLVTLTTGNNDLDFTGITLLAGDLNQDGVINSTDLTIVRNNIGKNDLEARGAADINLDGVVNGQDFSLMIFSLSNRYDE